MKKLFFLFVMAATCMACKNNGKKEGDTAAKLFRGEFIYTKDAAVLKGEDFIYGVELGGLTKELSEKVAPLKREEFDMVPVVIMGILKPNPLEEGWDELIEVTEIIGVSRPTSPLATKVKAPTTPEEEGTTPKKEQPKANDGHNHDHHNH